LSEKLLLVTIAYKTNAWAQKPLTLHTAYAFHMGNTASLTSPYAIVKWLSKTADKQAKKDTEERNASSHARQQQS
jgi:hypothetical protein